MEAPGEGLGPGTALQAIRQSARRKAAGRSASRCAILNNALLKSQLEAANLGRDPLWGRLLAGSRPQEIPPEYITLFL